MKVYCYVRCSSEDSFETGNSVATQLKKCQLYATIKDLKIDKNFIEQCSGSIKFEKREKGFSLLQMLNKGDAILCSHLDRYGRNHLDLLQSIEKFKKQGVQLHLVDVGGEVTGSDLMGSVFIKLLSVFSEFYAQQCSQKQKATKDRMFKEHKFRGGKKPFGYDVDDNGSLVKCEKEQIVIRLMRFLRKEGKTFREISNQITNSTRKKFPVSDTFAYFNFII